MYFFLFRFTATDRLDLLGPGRAGGRKEPQFFEKTPGSNPNFRSTTTKRSQARPRNDHPCAVQQQSTYFLQLQTSTNTFIPRQSRTVTMDGWVERLIQRAQRKELFRSESALHEACYASVELQAVQQILTLHPEANMIADGNGRIPLHWALTSKNQHDKARLLLQHLMAQGENFPLEEIMMVRNDLGYTALDHACCTDAPADIIESILSMCPQAATSTNTRKLGKTPLHMLLEYNKSNGTKMNTASVSLLLKAFPEAVSVRDRMGNLPLHYAVYSQTNYEAFRLLLSASMRMGCLEVKNEMGHTILHAACMNDSPVNVFQCLLEAWPCNVGQVDNCGNSPLHLSFAHRTSTELKSRLIHFGGEELFGAVNDRGQIPLQQGLVEDVFSILRLMPHVIRTRVV